MRRQRARRAWQSAALIIGLTAVVSGARGAQKPEWPQFHGPRRDNMSTETGLLKQWPEGGPKLVWTAKGIGSGFSTVAIAGKRIYITGNIGDHTVIAALRLDGRSLWQARNGPACRHQHAGTRSTPTIEEHRLYHMNADGDLVCLDARTGRHLWGLNILKKFGGRNITWGFAESLLIDGDNVICTPGGQETGMVALNKITGTTVWTCTGTRDKPGYCSPTLFEHGGVRQIAVLMSRSVIGVNADTGKLLWQEPHVCPFEENITAPLFHDGRLLISTRTTGTRLFELKTDGDRVTLKERWGTAALTNQHGGMLVVNGHIYGECHGGQPWAVLDFGSGTTTYKGRGIGRASITYADGRLYLLSFSGTMALVRPDPRTFAPVSQFRVPKGGRGPFWAHPVVCGGRLYVRHDDTLFAYDIAER